MTDIKDTTISDFWVDSLTELFWFVRKMSIKDVVDDPDWQELRQAFVGTWKEQPVANCLALRGYLGRKPWIDPIKIRQVLNYLTGSGFRLGIISHPDIDDLLAEVRQSWHQGLKSKKRR